MLFVALPSRVEGFGLPIIEAIASGTLMVSTRAGGAEDVIEDEVNEYLVEIDDWHLACEHITLNYPPSNRSRKTKRIRH